LRISLYAFLVIVLITGCASHDPVNPSNINPSLQDSHSAAGSDGPYRLWGEWTFYINAEHDRIDAVPARTARFHLNSLKFLESYCTDCVEVTQIKNNGDSTIDLTVKIKHPFTGHPEYTGFDVKGIIMFDGSWEHEGYWFFYPWAGPFRVSWRNLGDPQVLNADGYTMRWSPSWDSGSDLPIFNYYEGKYSSGSPTANVNAYKNFYTDEDRHMFRHDGIVTETYTIWLPPGEPITAGYAVEACWEPPLTTPVTDPASEFPLTANQPEAYEFFFNVNNGEPITELPCCGLHEDPSQGYMYSKQWGGHTAQMFSHFSIQNNNGYYWLPCGDEYPDQYCVFHVFFVSEGVPDGDYIGVAINFDGLDEPPWALETAYSVFEFTVDLE
jgi:hypothetical protein